MNMSKLRKLAAILLLVFVIGAVGATVYFLTAPYNKAKPFDIAAIGEQFGTITMQCRYDENSRELTVTQSTQYINKSSKSLNEIKFHIYANAYQENAAFPPVAKNEIAEAYPNGFSHGDIKINNVVGGTAKLESTDKTVLSVGMLTPMPPNTKRTVTIDYAVRLANIKHRLGWTDNFVNLGNFYPVPAVYENGWQTHSYSSNGDPFYNDLYNFDVTLTAPEDYIIAHSGEEISPRRYRAYAIRDFAMVLSKNFKILTAGAGNTAVNYYFVNDDTPEIALQTAVKALSYFSREFWHYPYTTLAVVQTDFLHGGMEYGSLVYISADIDSKTVSYQTVIVHEIAHQWWYGIVGNNQTKTAWIDEGLAEYSTAVFFENHREYGETIDKIAASNLSALSLYDEILKRFGTVFDKSMSRDINSFGSGYEYTFCTYCRGMLLFYNIAKMAGYEKFNSGLGAFAAANKFTFGTQSTLVSALEDALRTKLGVYFDNYIAG
jgi:hypothetical protein